MRLVLDNLKIELENQQEIRDFWNVISFALDLQAQRDEELCFTYKGKTFVIERNK